MTSSLSPIRDAQEANRWLVTDSDGTVFIVQRFTGGDPVMVSIEGRVWVCSEDGPQSSNRPTQATTTCVHVQAVGRRLPASAVREVLAAVRNRPKPKRGATPAHPGKSAENTAAEEAVAASLARGADKRAARAAAHDEAFVAATPVVVRQASVEDKAKLEAARARKHRLVGASDPD